MRASESGTGDLQGSSAGYKDNWAKIKSGSRKKNGNGCESESESHLSCEECVEEK